MIHLGGKKDHRNKRKSEIIIRRLHQHTPYKLKDGATTNDHQYFNFKNAGCPDCRELSPRGIELLVQNST